MPSTSRASTVGSRFSRFRFGGTPLIAIGIIAVTTVAIIVGINFARQGAGSPQVGDHWHAVYRISICGQVLDPIPSTSAGLGIHTHGDGLIHSHPASVSQTGGNADLDHFFQATGRIEFSKDYIKLGDQEFRNGSPCPPPDGPPGSVKMFVNGLPNDRFEDYVPQSGDIIKIEFSADAES